jgi:hypothetical protein
MKRTILICSALLILNIQAQHSKETDVMLVSMPKSGSNFFANTLVESNPDVCYKHEYFNKIQTVQMADFLNIELKRRYEEYFFALEFSDEQFETIYKVTWGREPEANFTKEVFSALRIPLFQRKFTIFALYRHRKYTFPTNSSHLYLPLYKSFERVHFKDPDIANIKTFIEMTTQTDQQKECAIHTVANYIILRDCARYNLPVLDYEQLLTLSDRTLHSYIKERIPHQIFTDNLPANIQQNREDLVFLKKRAEKFEAAQLEPFCQQLINFLKKRDPDMPYWFMFD